MLLPKEIRACVKGVKDVPQLRVDYDVSVLLSVKKQDREINKKDPANPKLTRKRHREPSRAEASR